MTEFAHWPPDRREQNSISHVSQTPLHFGPALFNLAFARVYSCLYTPACYGEGGVETHDHPDSLCIDTYYLAVHLSGSSKKERA